MATNPLVSGMKRVQDERLSEEAENLSGVAAGDRARRQQVQRNPFLSRQGRDPGVEPCSREGAFSLHAR